MSIIKKKIKKVFVVSFIMFLRRITHWGQRQQEVCDVVMQQRSVNQVTGYKTYIEFGGNVWQMTTTIPYTKGEFLSVNVDITPAE